MSVFGGGVFGDAGPRRVWRERRDPNAPEDVAPDDDDDEDHR